MRRLLFVIIAALLSACANQKPPVGGPEDTQPPVIVNANPPDESAGINPERIVLEFDEYFSVNNLQQNMYISPYMDNPYKHKVKGKKLILTFEKPFPENTTYTLFFNNSIKDLTKNNETKHLRYVFSTGDHVDSLRLKVNTEFPLTQKACSECIVGLLAANDTTTFHKSNPIYFAYTDKKGEATIRNIKPAAYRVYAFKDLNKNYMHDPNEVLSFLPDALTFDTIHLEADLIMITPDTRKQKIEKLQTIDNVLHLTFSKGVDNLHVTDSSCSKINSKYWFTDAYNPFVEYDRTTKPHYVVTTDSLSIIDTLVLKYPKKEKTDEAYIHITSTQRGLKPNEKIVLQLSHTPTLIVDSLIYFKPDSVRIPNTGWKWDSITNILSINPPKDQKTIQLYIDSAAIQTAHISSKDYSQLLNVYEETETGILRGNISCPNDNTTLELLNNQYNILQSVSNAKEFEFTYLPPGEYLLRLKVDRNKDGKWNAGDVQTLELPEPIVFHDGKISLRKNWEINNLFLKCPLEKVD